MNTDILEVVLDDVIKREAVPVVLPTSTYVDALRRQGYGYVRVLGLAGLGARGFDGNNINDYFVPIEHDVAFLLEHYLGVEELATGRHTDRVCTYIADGCFELNAVLARATVHVRVGFFRDSRFEEPFRDAATIDIHAYVSMWRSVASGIVDGAEGRGRRASNL